MIHALILAATLGQGIPLNVGSELSRDPAPTITASEPALVAQKPDAGTFDLLPHATTASILKRDTLVGAGAVCSGGDEFMTILADCRGNRFEVEKWRQDPGLPGWAIGVLVGGVALLSVGAGFLLGWVVRENSSPVP